MMIEYRNGANEVVATMNEVHGTKDSAVSIAQKYMTQFPSIITGHVLTAESETVVTRTTGWQKRNG